MNHTLFPVGLVIAGSILLPPCGANEKAAKPPGITENKPCGGSTAKAKLDATQIERLQFEGVPFKDAITTLRAKLRQAGADTNILVIDPSGKLWDAEVVGIDIRNIPASAAIGYLAEAVGARVEFRPNSVVIAPK